MSAIVAVTALTAANAGFALHSFSAEFDSRNLLSGVVADPDQAHSGTRSAPSNRRIQETPFDALRRE